MLISLQFTEDDKQSLEIQSEKSFDFPALDFEFFSPSKSSSEKLVVLSDHSLRFYQIDSFDLETTLELGDRYF